jgi:hypothetical protein
MTSTNSPRGWDMNSNDLRERSTRPLTVADLERALADDRHLGYGFAERRNLTAARSQQMGRAIIREANALGLDYEALFHWTNSKHARWACDEAGDAGSNLNQIVARYLTATTVRSAQATA